LAERTGVAGRPLTEQGWRFEGFFWFGSELGRDWLPRANAAFDAVLPAEGAAARPASARPGRTRTTLSIWRALRQPRALLRVEVLETDSAASARRSMLEVAAEIASPGLRPWMPEADEEAGVALDNGAMALFTRGNLLLVLRSAGLEAIDVRAMAQLVDRWLVDAGSIEPPAHAGAAVGTGPVWLRWRVGEAGMSAPGALEGRDAVRRSQLTVVTSAHAAAWETRA
jgi:hypothetical protein